MEKSATIKIERERGTSLDFKRSSSAAKPLFYQTMLFGRLFMSPAMSIFSCMKPACVGLAIAVSKCAALRC